MIQRKKEKLETHFITQYIYDIRIKAYTPRSDPVERLFNLKRQNILEWKVLRQKRGFLTLPSEIKTVLFFLTRDRSCILFQTSRKLFFWVTLWQNISKYLFKLVSLWRWDGKKCRTGRFSLTLSLNFLLLRFTILQLLKTIQVNWRTIRYNHVFNLTFRGQHKTVQVREFIIFEFLRAYFQHF